MPKYTLQAEVVGGVHFIKLGFGIQDIMQVKEMNVHRLKTSPE